MRELEHSRMAGAVARVVAMRAPKPRMRRITICGPQIAAFPQVDGVDALAARPKVFLASGEYPAHTISGLDQQAGTP